MAEQSKKKILYRILGYGKKYPATIFFIIFTVLLSTVLGLAPPWLIKYGIDKFVLMQNSSLLWVVGVAMILITLIQGVVDYIKRYLSEYIAQNIIHDIRTGLYSHLNSLSFGFYDDSKIGDIMSRVTADADRMRNFLSNACLLIFSNFLIIFGIFIVLLNWNFRLALLYLFMIPFIYLGMRAYSKRVHPLFQKSRKKFAKLNSIIKEDVLGIEIVKLFGSEKREKKEFTKVNNQFSNFNIKSSKVSAFWMPYVNFFMGFSTVLVLLYGGYLVINEYISIGVLAGFTSYIAMLLRPIRQTGMMINSGNQAIVSADRIFQLLDKKAEIKDKENAIEINNSKDIKGNIVFDNVSFSYKNGNKVLKNISFNVDAGKSIAIVGPTGAGKTTLVHLLMRFYNLVDGAVYLDDYNIEDLKIDSLRDNIGIVMQDNFIFASSFRENISYGKPDATRDEIIKAAKLAQIHEFIKSLPLGYETPIGERGVNLSGGQKQRLAIARVFLKDYKILILDEPTSNIDTEVEAQLQKALKAVIKGRTTFIIAHRLWTVKNVDKIIVIKDGSIIETGTHDELINLNGYYSKANKKNTLFMEEK